MLPRDLIEFVFDGGATKRYHTHDTLRQQSVAEHSFGVAMFCYLLADHSPSANLLIAALSHDLAEHRVGDVSSPVKREHPELRSLIYRIEKGVLAKFGFEPADLTPAEERTLKIADNLEGIHNCIRERTLGNIGVAIVFMRYCSYIEAMMPRGKELECYNVLLTKWREINERSK